MRIISQDGRFDLPYEKVSLSLVSRYGSDCKKVEGTRIIADFGVVSDNDVEMATYSTEEKAIKVMKLLRETYAGRFIINAENSDDFDKYLKESMKYGFGTVMIKETNENKVEFNNLNSYFIFPKDEEIGLGEEKK